MFSYQQKLDGFLTSDDVQDDASDRLRFLLKY